MLREWSRLRCALAALVVACFLLAGAKSVTADEWVDAHKGGSWQYGTQGMMKVVNVYVDTGYKVNSIYHYYDGHRWLEIGWSEYGPNGAFEHFSSYTYYSNPPVEEHEGTPQVDVSYKYTVRLLSQSSMRWRWIVNSVTVREEVLPNMPVTGRNIASSERDDPDTNGWAHWWDLKYWDYDSWEPWDGLGLWYDNMAGYHLNKISNTEAYCHPD